MEGFCLVLLLYPRYSSYVPPLFLRTRLDEVPIHNGIFTDFAPTLVRRKSEGTTED